MVILGLISAVNVLFKLMCLFKNVRYHLEFSTSIYVIVL